MERTYTKKEKTRLLLIRKAFRIFAHKGIVSLSLRQIAQELGISHSLILQHFGSKNGFIEAVLSERDRLQEDIVRNYVEQYGLYEAILRIIEHNLRIPGIIELDTRLRAETCDCDHPLRPYMERLHHNFIDMLTQQIIQEQKEGRIAPDADPHQLSRHIAVFLWGMQLAWSFDPSFDMVGAMKDYLSQIFHMNTDE